MGVCVRLFRRWLCCGWRSARWGLLWFRLSWSTPTASSCTARFSGVGCWRSICPAKPRFSPHLRVSRMYPLPYRPGPPCGGSYSSGWSRCCAVCLRCSPCLYIPWRQWPRLPSCSVFGSCRWSASCIWHSPICPESPSASAPGQSGATPRCCRSRRAALPRSPSRALSSSAATPLSGSPRARRCRIPLGLWFPDCGQI